MNYDSKETAQQRSQSGRKPRDRFVIGWSDPLEDAYDGPFTVFYQPHDSFLPHSRE